MRTCNCCGKEPLYEGFVIGGGEEYYCSDECLNKEYTPEEIEELELGEDDSESYWTEWTEDDDEEDE